MIVGFDDKVCEILKRPLPLHKRRGKGGEYTYHKGSDIIRCLNDAFKHGWSSEKLESEVVEDQVLMLVAITAVTSNGDTVTHQGYGSALIARSTSNNKIVDIGNSYKSAYTTALKKAAEQFGVGLGDESDAVAPSASNNKRRVPTQAVGNASTPKTAAGTPMRKPRKLPSKAPSTLNGSATGASKTVVAEAPAAAPAAAAARPGTASDLNTPSTAVQLKALANLSASKGKPEAALLKGAGLDKTSFSELTKEEAIKAMRYAQTL